MSPLQPELLVEKTLSLVELRFKGRRTEGHAPPLPIREGIPPEEILPNALDVGFLQNCGYWCYFDAASQLSAWPIPDGMSAHELALFGIASGIVHEQPQVGDIFLQYHKRRREFIHCGLVARVEGSDWLSYKMPYFDLYCLEGDTDRQGRPGGGYTMKVRRRLSPTLGDRFLRWAELDAVGGAV